MANVFLSLCCFGVGICCVLWLLKIYYSSIVRLNSMATQKNEMKNTNERTNTFRLSLRFIHVSRLFLFLYALQLIHIAWLRFNFFSSFYILLRHLLNTANNKCRRQTAIATTKKYNMTFSSVFVHIFFDVIFTLHRSHHAHSNHSLHALVMDLPRTDA